MDDESADFREIPRHSVSPICVLAVFLMATLTISPAATEAAAREFLAACRVRPIRAMGRFVEEELIIPDGPYEGLRFRCDRQPYTRLLYEAIDSGRWNRFVITGPTQSGKTLSVFVVPILYHLFEVGETVICGLPNMDMAGDKWNEDIRPAIAASRYRHLLPTNGQGSRSAAKVDAIRFKNGATLKFMSGGGSDKKRAAFTSRVVVITETDGLDESGGNSREADKLTQIEARTRAYGSRKRIYLECTVSVEAGRTWREYNNGTASRIILPCPHCGAWVSPERENFTGWQEAENAVAAAKSGHFSCPECTQAWSEAERVTANGQARLIHRGEEIVSGRGEGERGSGGAATRPIAPSLTGRAVETKTLGFRWSAVNNLFQSAGDVAADEWRASRAADEDNAERELRQFVWCLPYIPPVQEITNLDEREICERQSALPAGIVSDARTCLTLGVDVGKWRLHWVLAAWLADGSGQIVDYGKEATGVSDDRTDHAVLKTLRLLRDANETGWKTPQGEIVPIDMAWVDAHWLTKVVKTFCGESGGKWQPSIGFGVNSYSEGTRKAGSYSRPKSTGATVWRIGDHYHAARIKGQRQLTWEFDADYAKSRLHEALACPQAEEGAVTLPAVESPIHHQTFVRHLLSEKQVEEFVPIKGTILRWEQSRAANHWFDAAVLARLAAHCYLSFYHRPVARQKPRPESEKREFTTPGGQEFFATARRG